MASPPFFLVTPIDAFTAQAELAKRHQTKFGTGELIAKGATNAK